MRIQLRIEGGFSAIPHLNKPIVVNSHDLPRQEAHHLRVLVQQVSFFTLQSEHPPTRGADYRHYTISIEDGEQEHTVKFFDPIEDKEIQELLAFLKGFRTR